MDGPRLARDNFACSIEVACSHVSGLWMQPKPTAGSVRELRPHHSLRHLVGAARGPSTSSLDHLVGAGEQRRRHIKAERSRGLKIDDEFELGGLHDRQVGRLGAFEDLTGIDASGATNRASARLRMRVANAASISRLVLALRI